MSKIKGRIKQFFFQLPTMWKIRLYRRLYQGKTPLFTGVWAWLRSKMEKEEDDPHHFFVDYENPEGIYTAETVLEILSGLDVVCFDVFDTLLFRKVKKPTDIFALMEQRLEINGIAYARKQAEWEARQEKYRKTGCWEITFSEIYEKMSQFTAEQRQKIQETELGIETEQLTANPVMMQVVRGLLTMEIPIVVISDMYLDGRAINQLLQGCGYPVFQRLYVSSEHGVSKSDGKLFQYVRERERWEGKCIAHIGDNFHSDVKMARKHFISGIHYIR